MPEQNIYLNLLFVDFDGNFKIYRKPYSDQDTIDTGVKRYRLPKDQGSSEYIDYWVSFKFCEEYSEYECTPFDNFDLTKWLLGNLLIQGLRKLNSPQIHYNAKSINPDIEVSIEKLELGDRIIKLRPYYLNKVKKFGFLIDYRFHPTEKKIYNREVQRLSLSLDKNYRSNTRYYIDKDKIIKGFIEKTLKQVIPITTETASFRMHFDFAPIDTFFLKKRNYVFKATNSDNSQMSGLKKYGPYQKVEGEVQYIFLFENKYTNFANELFLNLSGKINPGVFSGMERMFGLQFATTDLKKVELMGYDKEKLDNALSRIDNIVASQSSKKSLVVYLEPESETKYKSNDLSNPYYYLKYNLTRKKIPLQVVNYSRQNSSEKLKWSSANIGLAMFAKLGGIPWLLTPNVSDCLIIGIGSAHEKDSNGRINKFFAYSVCLDTSGEYKRLQILSDQPTFSEYLRDLERKIATVISDEGVGKYKYCALHVPFKIRKKEIDVIKRAIMTISGIEFQVIKINTENSFFAISDHNTLIPYESTCADLGKDEFLIWFEGLKFGKEHVYNKVANPAHIAFLTPPAINSRYTQRDYLQDIISLSGANWRGFNAKQEPISTYYPTIIARFSKIFEKYPDFKEEVFENDTPWFL